MKKIAFILISLTFLIFPLGAAFADGGFIPLHPDEDIYEPSQVALIKYDGNREELYIKANYSGNTTNFVWIVPTPSLPIVEAAPRELFTDLSYFTDPTHYIDHEFLRKTSYSADDNSGVTVIREETIEMYQVYTLSAKGGEGLMQWLEENGFMVSQSIRETLDWYIAKNWYFVAIRINPSEKLKELISKFQKTDSGVTRENFTEKSVDYLIESIKNESYEDFIIVFKIINDAFALIGEDQGIPTEEEFKIIVQDYKEEESEDPETEVFIKELLSWMIEGVLEEVDPTELDSYSNALSPLKFTFESSEMVYPLKISRISTLVPEQGSATMKTNVVLLYILSDAEMRAPYFDVENAKLINRTILNQMEEESRQVFYQYKFSDLKEVVGDEEYILTKMRRTFAAAEMDDDLIFLKGVGDVNLLDKDQYVSLSQSTDSKEWYHSLTREINTDNIPDRLKGKILLKVEDKGRAYYVNPVSATMHFLGKPYMAYDVMKNQGIGITNRDLERIPIGLSELSGKDSDGDGLSDIFEDAIGTDKYQADTDGDGYDDRTEILNGYSPLLPFGPKISYDQNFINSKKGMIFLQVENNGEAWYVSPADGKRYFLGRPTDAFNIMRGLGLGISNKDFDNLN